MQSHEDDGGRGKEPGVSKKKSVVEWGMHWNWLTSRLVKIGGYTEGSKYGGILVLD